MYRGVSYIEVGDPTRVYHYRTRLLCRVLETLGKGRKTLGKEVAECSTRRCAHGLSSTGEAGYAKCFFSGTRQTFAVCHAALGKKEWNGTAERDERDRTGRGTLPSAGLVALGKDPKFAECQICSTRRTLKLCRVPDAWHSAKFGSLPSATRLALGGVSNFAECLGNYTRQICFPVNRKMVALPSVRLKTLGKACCFFVFFLFFM